MMRAPEGSLIEPFSSSLFILHHCLKSELLLWTTPAFAGAGQKHATFSLCVCVCFFSLIDFPLFNLEFSWAVVFHGSAVTQTGQRKVGSLFLINTVSHMAPQLPKIFMQNPSPSSAGLHKFPKGWKNSASFVFGDAPVFLGSSSLRSLIFSWSRFFLQPTQASSSLYRISWYRG